jgi:hypothetical protein
LIHFSKPKQNQFEIQGSEFAIGTHFRQGRPRQLPAVWVMVVSPMAHLLAWDGLILQLAKGMGQSPAGVNWTVQGFKGELSWRLSKR